MVHINGKDENAAGMTIQKYLDENDYIVTHIAVELSLIHIQMCIRDSHNDGTDR